MHFASSPQTRLLSAVFAPLGTEGKVQRVEERIVAGISTGVLGHGDRLPSEADLAASLGVSTVTAREALVGLRSRGLVETRRGREGGTFVTLPSGDRSELVRRRLCAMSRVELRDLGIHYSAIAATAAELAAATADEDSVEPLAQAFRAIEGPRAAEHVGEFFLELAAMSQSARLTREYVRLHTEFGVLLQLAAADRTHLTQLVEQCAGILHAVRRSDAAAARALVNARVRDGIAWLIREQIRLAPAAADPHPTPVRRSP